MNADRRAFIDAALSYSEQSPQWPIFPVHPVKKTPLIKTGRDHAEHASTDPDVIRGWLECWPWMSMAMPTGRASGAVVIDLDAKHGGEARLAELEDDKVLGPLPRSRMARTQSGGLHIYLAYPQRCVRVLTGAGADSPLGRLLCGQEGVDVRADGGIIVLPPSRGYQWISDDDDPLPEIPAIWLAAIQGAGDPPPVTRRRPTTSSDDVIDIVSRIAPILDGNRNDRLFRIAVRLRRDGLPESEVLAAIEHINTARVSPPLPDREIRKLVQSASRGK